jgi:hypothetical protein
MLDLLQDFFDINVTGLQPSPKDLEVQVAETNPVCCLFAACLLPVLPVCCLFAGAGAYLWYSFLSSLYKFTGRHAVVIIGVDS